MQLRIIKVQADRECVLRPDHGECLQAGELVQAVSKDTYKPSQIVNNDLALVENHRGKIEMSKPIAIRCAILEIVKLVMYEFYNNCLLPKFGNHLRLCFTDMDSFSCHVESENLCNELRSILNEWLDTEFPTRAYAIFATKLSRGQ